MAPVGSASDRGGGGEPAAGGSATPTPALTPADGRRAVIGAPVDRYFPANRAEHLIAAGRTVLACVSLVAIWFDPTQPTHYADVAYKLLAGYGIYAALLWLWLARVAVLPARFGLLTHGVDLLFFVSLQVFTAASSSPFFVYFLFALVAASIRWPLRGVMWTGAAVLVAFTGLGLASAPPFDEGLDVLYFLVRAGYLVVTTGLLAYLGVCEQRLRSERARLTDWPQTVTAEGDVPGLLRRAAAILAVPRTILVWERADEPWLQVDSWSGGTFESTRLPPGSLGAVVAPALQACVFLSADASSPSRVLVRRDGRLAHHDGRPLDPALQARCRIGSVLAVPLWSSSASGWLFAVDRPRMTSDDLLLGELVAREIAARLDRADLLRSLEQAGATRERERLAADLHDGLLQSLTGIDLKLERLREMHPVLAPEIQDLQATIAAEHQELRAFVRGLPGEAGSPVAPFDLAGHLRALPERVMRESGVTVDVPASEVLEAIPPATGRSIVMMVREAVANAVRHGAASSVRVTVRVERGMAVLVIENDGRPFPFTGRYGDDELEARQIGPRSLQRRVRRLGGRLDLSSGDTGVRVEIALPVPGARDGDQARPR